MSSYLSCGGETTYFYRFSNLYVTRAYNCLEIKILTSRLHKNFTFRNIARRLCCPALKFLLLSSPWASNELYCNFGINIQFQWPRLKTLTYIIFLGYCHQPSDSRFDITPAKVTRPIRLYKFLLKSPRVANTYTRGISCVCITSDSKTKSPSKDINHPGKNGNVAINKCTRFNSLAHHLSTAKVSSDVSSLTIFF